MKRTMLVTLLTAAALFAVSATARAAVIITAMEVGGNVVFTGSGELNLAGVSSNGGYTTPGGINPRTPFLGLGANPSDVNTEVDLYGLLEIPSVPFGSYVPTIADSGTGDHFGVDDVVGAGPAFFVPNNYVSGAPLSGSLTFNGTDFATLGIVPGAYVWNWGAGANADSITLNIVPEPATITLLGLLILSLPKRGELTQPSTGVVTCVNHLTDRSDLSKLIDERM